MVIYLVYFLLSPVLWVLLHTFGLIFPKIRTHIFSQFPSYKKLKNNLRSNAKPVVIFHAASAGEFEQLRPILGKMDREKYFIIQTFFSPTIYLKEKDSELFDDCCYHPFDFPWSALYFFMITRPEYYIITRHDIWPNHLVISNILNINSILINANLYKESIRLSPYLISANRWIYSKFNLVFTGSKRLENNLVKLVESSKIIVSGDTRFDQVLERKNNYSGTLLSESYTESVNLIFGSIIRSDFKIIFNSLGEEFPNGHDSLHLKNQRLIFVPHETGNDAIQEIEKELLKLNLESKRYSQVLAEETPDVLIVDMVGILADLYFHSFFAYVGAGFGAGVHSVIEPAVHGCIVSFGPNIQILDEAIDLFENKIGFMVQTKSDFLRLLNSIQNENIRNQYQKKTLQYVTDHPLSSLSIINRIFKERNESNH